MFFDTSLVLEFHLFLLNHFFRSRKKMNVSCSIMCSKGSLLLEKQLLKTEFLGKQVLRWRLICMNFIRECSQDQHLGKGGKGKKQNEAEE